MLRRLGRSQLSHFRFQSTLSLVGFNNKEVSVNLDGKSVTFKNTFLRDSCTSLESVDASTSQKLFTTAEAATDISITKEPSVVDNKLKIQWSNNGKILNSTYSASFLKEYSTPAGPRKDLFFDNDRTLWDHNELISNLDSLHHDYEAYLNDEKTFFDAVFNMNKYGLCFIDNIPRPTLDKMNESNVSQWPVAKLAERFGYIRKTFYGSLFDVKNLKSEAKNLAYTNTFLPLHMDLLYYESPPGVQMLHAIDNSTLGGENIFCDSFLAAEHVRKVDPVAYTALTKIPITFHYDNNNEYYYYKRPLVIEDKDITGDFPKIHAINYSPPFQGPFEIGITKNDPAYDMFDDFIRGFQLFEKFINDPANHYEVKMKEGTCVFFENRRVLHSRNEFSDSNGGDRWLMGTYVDGDSLRSKLRIGYRKFN